jgi:sugar lactone lactonase YvrE
MQNNFTDQSADDRQRQTLSKRKIIFIAAVFLLIAIAVSIFLFASKAKPIPTNMDAIGKVTTLAGRGVGEFADAVNLQAGFSDPFGVVVDVKGNVLIADGGASNRIRKITLQGNVETVAGSEEGFADGAANEAKFNTPSAIAIDKDGNLFIADTANNRIRKIDAKAQVTTVAGTGAAGFADGAANEAVFDSPIGLAVDAQGNLFVADTYNDRIRKITKDGAVTTIAGTGVAGFADGAANEAMFDTPCGIAVDKQGNLFVADTGNNAIRKITRQGEVTTFAKNNEGEQNSDARLSYPVGLALTQDGFLFVSNQNSGRIQMITPVGEIKNFAGKTSGFADGIGEGARFNGAYGIAVDNTGNLFVADANNYLIRKITPVLQTEIAASVDAEVFIQPLAVNETDDGKNANEANGSNHAAINRPESLIPKLDKESLGIHSPFVWPLNPQTDWHEVAGVVGEVRGWFNGEARDHLHSGLDIAGKMGEPCLSIIDEKVSAPISTWGYNETGEGLHIGLMSYIHIRVGRDSRDQIQISEKFKPRTDAQGTRVGIRVRRGTRFKIGDFIGTLNRLYHVHMNLGPRNAEANALQFPFVNFKDSLAPTLEANGIEVTTLSGQPFKEKVKGRLLITGDVAIVVTAYDLVDGNNKSRKLGLYRLGYQLLNEDGSPVQGFEQPLINIEFNRLPADDAAVRKVYAEGSGVSAYGTPTKFKYIVTNRVRDGVARQGLLRTSQLPAGNYTLKVVAEDYAGNGLSGSSAELAITIK